MNNIDYLHEHFDLEQLEEDFGLNGLDYIKSLSVDELEEDYSDYKKE
jgi:hypothetical protein